MAAGCAARRGLDVTVIERNPRMARKVMITGKGRCNVTNRCTIDEFIEHVPENGRFLYSALNQFSPQDAMDFFEQQGVPLKTERGNRVFPVSDKARGYRGRFGAGMRGGAGVAFTKEEPYRCAWRTGYVPGVRAGGRLPYCRPMRWRFAQAGCPIR